MKRSTALSRLHDVAEGLERLATWGDVRVVAGYVHGDLVDGLNDLERVQLVFVVDEPPEDVAWMTRPPHLEAAVALVRFDKLPLSWTWRTVAWPVWNHRIIRAVRFWSAEDHIDETVLAALTEGSTDQLREEGTGSELLEQLRVERDISRGHLKSVLDRFYDREWRQAHRGGQDVGPEDHLWWATAGLFDLDDAIN